jgi:hypothetical protein
VPPRLPCLLNDPPVAAGLTWLAGARLFDGTGAPMRERVSVLVEDGRIAAIAGPADAPPEAARVAVDGDPLARPELLLERESIWLVARLGTPVAGTSLDRNPAQPTAA